MIQQVKQHNPHKSLKSIDKLFEFEETLKESFE